MREYLPILIVGAIIGVFAVLFIVAYLLLKRSNPQDYDRLNQGDRLILADVHKGLETGRFTLTDATGGFTVELEGQFTFRQREMLLAGGLLPYTRKE